MALKQLLSTFLLGIVSLLLVVSLWQLPLVLFFALLTLSLIALWLRKDKKDVKLYLVAAVWGTCAEIFAIRFGVWTYATPDILGIPLWLPLLWGIASVFIKQMWELI